MITKAEQRLIDYLENTMAEPEDEQIETCQNCKQDFPVTEDTWVKWTGGGRWGLDPPEPSFICSDCEAKIEAAWGRREEREEYRDAEDL